MKKKTVLLVDDTDMSIELQKSFLRTAQLTLLSAGSGSDALSLVRAAPPDLIFMGATLPDLSGVECCRRIKSDQNLAKIPVVILSHSTRPTDIAAYRQAGCDEVLLKPINRHLFFETARAFLGVHLWTEDRFLTRIPVEFGLWGKARQSAVTYDINIGGIFVESKEVFSVGMNVELLLPLPGRAQPIRCHAMVAWANTAENPRKTNYPVGMGIEFFALSGTDLTDLEIYLKKLAAQT